MSVSNTNTLNDLVAQIVSNEAVGAAYATRVMRGLITASQVPQGGNSLVMPIFSGIAAGALTEGTATSSTYLSSTGLTLTPVERGVYVQISKAALWGDPFTDLAPYGQEIGRCLASDEDALITTEFASLTTNSIGASGDILSKEHLLSGIAKLEAQNAPGPYFGVFHPVVWADIRSSIGDAAVMGGAGKVVVEGFGEGLTNLQAYVGNPFGVSCFISTNVPSTDATYTNAIFSKQAFGYAFMKDLGVDVDDNVVARAFDLMGWYAGDAGILVDAYGCKITAGTVA